MGNRHCDTILAQIPHGRGADFGAAFSDTGTAYHVMAFLLGLGILLTPVVTLIRAMARKRSQNEEPGNVLGVFVNQFSEVHRPVTGQVSRLWNRLGRTQP